MGPQKYTIVRFHPSQNFAVGNLKKEKFDFFMKKFQNIFDQV